MEVADFVTPATVVIGLRAKDKHQLLDEIARRAATALGLEPAAILEPLLAREALGSTGVGRGIAIPHARIAGLPRLFGLLARLERPVDFTAIDDQPVDLVCLLLTPASAAAEHLPALACLSRRLREKGVADRLRAARDGAALYAALTGAQNPRRLQTDVARPTNRTGHQGGTMTTGTPANMRASLAHDHEMRSCLKIGLSPEGAG